MTSVAQDVIALAVIDWAIGQFPGSRSFAEENSTMWLPTPIYERMPQALLLLGLLLMSSGLYLGFDYQWSLFYYVVGVACCLMSMRIFTKRLAARKPAGSRASGDVDAAVENLESSNDDVGEAKPAA